MRNNKSGSPYISMRMKFIQKSLYLVWSSGKIVQRVFFKTYQNSKNNSLVNSRGFPSGFNSFSRISICFPVDYDVKDSYTYKGKIRIDNSLVRVHMRILRSRGFDSNEMEVPTGLRVIHLFRNESSVDYEQNNMSYFIS